MQNNIVKKGNVRCAYARAIEQGYLYREQEAKLTGKLSGYFSEEAEKILASLPVLDTLVESLIDKGLLTLPENGIGAEGVWMYVRE